MKKWLLGLSLLSLFFLSGCTKEVSRQSEELQRLEIGNKTLQVAVMQTPEELQQGLSGRSEVPGDGMLFILPKRQEAHFWMKDMRFAIDMIWIDGDQIVGVAENVQPPSPGQTLDTLPTMSSNQPVTAVLEVPAGDFERLGFTVGVRVELES